MAANYGSLELRESEQNGQIVQALMGHLNVPQIISGAIAIGENPNAPADAKMTHIVKIKSNGQWAALGKAGFTRKNGSAAWYLNMAIESPMIKAKLGDTLWLRAFPQEGNLGGKPDAESYDIVWGGGGKRKLSAGADLDDSIPF